MPPRRKEEQPKSDKDISTEFSDAIWDAAGAVGGRASGVAKVIPASDESSWLVKDVLTFGRFCASPDHMNFPPLSERQLRVADYMFGDDPKKMFDTGRNLAVLVFGKGAGKDTIAVLMILYIVYVLSCLKNPQKFLGVPDHADIDLLNVASSREQADTVFFHKLKTAVFNWSWLKSRYDIQVSGRFYSAAQDRALDNRVTITNDAIVFPNNIRAFSWSSEGETLEGKSLIAYVMDEADAFKSGSETRNAEKIFRVCRTSATSRFRGKHKGFVLSYPRSKNGFILTLYEKTKSFLNVYSDIACTWEVKPRDMFSPETFEFEGHRIPMDFYDDYRLDPIGSKRAFQCLAPLAEQAFIEEPDRVDAAARHSDPPAFEFRDKVEDGFIKKTISRAPYSPDRSVQHIVTMDLGLKIDPTAVALMHREEDKIIVDFITTWVPNEKEHVIVDLMSVEDVITSVCSSVTVKQVYGDHWNSALFIRRLQSKGIGADVAKVDYDDHEIFKRLLYAGNIVLPKHAGLLEEIKNLQLFSGKKVDHAEGAHNDMAMAVIMGVKMLIKVGKGGSSSNMAAEGEYINLNLNEAVEPYDPKETTGSDPTILIDGIPL